MTLCNSISMRRGGAPCRNEAAIDGLCLAHLAVSQRHTIHRTVANGSGNGTVIALPVLEATPPTPPADVPPSTAVPIVAAHQLGAAPELEDEAVATGQPEQPRTIRELDAIGAQLWGKVPVDVGAADKAAAAAADVQAAAPIGANLSAGAWTSERVEAYLRLLINPKLVADGKPELTAAELQEGGAIGAQILTDLFAVRTVNPYAALAAWGGIVLGTRYFTELLAWIADLARRRRGGRPGPAAAPRSIEQDQPAAATVPKSGWAA